MVVEAPEEAKEVHTTPERGRVPRADPAVGSPRRGMALTARAGYFGGGNCGHPGRQRGRGMGCEGEGGAHAQQGAGRGAAGLKTTALGLLGGRTIERLMGVDLDGDLGPQLPPLEGSARPLLRPAGPAGGQKAGTWVRWRGAGTRFSTHTEGTVKGAACGDVLGAHGGRVAGGPYHARRGQTGLTSN